MGFLLLLYVLVVLGLGEGSVLTGREELVLEANIESSVGVRCEGHPCLSHNVLWSSVLISNSVFYLQ